ncbi:UDP-N-acetylglucosamine enolpyruvyl transferase [Pseudomonas syringae pv. actinidiae]|uniref:UDP-N-acetylglucosamine enolpyruvyl transferase n=1 Tax=Pseudomonas syringae pv. actinidiae TaxID=103796 RepID=A0A2V0QKH8_PSESF|nr:UDP-N-acetylglucosamine enolpyruvyl transferase [Pseudomonas syringae pv. actinidiae]
MGREGRVKIRVNGQCPTGHISSPIGYAVTTFKSLGYFIRGNALVPSGDCLQGEDEVPPTHRVRRVA